MRGEHPAEVRERGQQLKFAQGSVVPAAATSGSLALVISPESGGITSGPKRLFATA